MLIEVFTLCWSMRMFNKENYDYFGWWGCPIFALDDEVGVTSTTNI